jgi:hypothetical protein
LQRKIINAFSKVDQIFVIARNFSESYDRDFKDILSVQDEITMNNLSALQVAIDRKSEARAAASERRRIDSNFTSVGLIKRFSIRDKPFLDQMVADLRIAGFK